MQDLRIDLEFRDKIPPMPVEDFEGLKADILRDGYVRDPLVVWDEENILLDGHHRWRVIQEHPELPYTTDRKSFPDRWAAIAWICANQLHKHNMNEIQRAKLIQEEHDAKQKSHGGDRRSEEFSSGENIHLKKTEVKNGKTRSIIAREHGITPGEVKTAVEVGRGIDRAAEVDPEFKREILSGEVKAKKSDLAAIRKLKTEEGVKAAVEEIRNPTPKPKPIRKADPEARKLEALIHETARDMRRENRKEYTQEDLVRDLKTIVDRFIQDIKQELALRRKVISDFDEIVEVLTECEKRLIEIEENVEKGVFA